MVDSANILVTVFSFVFIFLQDNGFVFEIVLCTALFMLPYHTRNNGIVWAATIVVSLFIFSVVWNIFVPTLMWTQIVKATLFHGIVFVGILATLRVEFDQAIFILVAAGTTQHIVFRIALALVQAILQETDMSKTMQGIVYASLFIPILAVIYFLVIRPLNMVTVPKMNNISLLFLLLGMLLAVNVFSTIFDSVADSFHQRQVYVAFILFDILDSAFILALLSQIVQKISAQQDASIIRQLLYRQRSHIENTKETIDLINVKAHDLKKQISLLDGSISEKQTQELKELVEAYDSTVITGNEALDVLLSQESLRCGQREIQFDRMVDGKCLSFIEDEDIYALFSNVMDNAIEAVEKIEDRSKRYIRLSVRDDKEMVVICVENPYCGNIVTHNGLLMTSKADKEYHGFGMKSIRMVAEKYNGYCSVRHDNNIFTITIIIPHAF